jgi:hypothetical protein
VPKRPPWADADDASGAPEEKRAKKQSDKDDALPAPEEKRAKKKSDKKVSFQEEPAQDAAPEPQRSPDARFYFVILDCDLNQKALLRSYGRELDIDDSNEFLVAIDSQKRSFGILGWSRPMTKIWLLSPTPLLKILPVCSKN